MNAVLTTETTAPAKAPAAEPIRRVLVLQNHLGLHCRPAALLINTLKGFVCTVTVETGGVTANGRSIFELMNLAAGYHAKLAFTISGPDASRAMAAIAQLFETNFVDAYDESHPLSHKQMRAF